MAMKETEPNHWDIVALKTNREGKMMSAFMTETFSSESDKIKGFHQWLKDDMDYQFVSYSYEQFSKLMNYIQSNYATLYPKFVIRMMKAHYWNIKSELVYKFRLSEKTTMKELLHLYQITPIKHSSDLMSEAMNVLTLAILYHFDDVHTKKLLNPNRKTLLRELYEKYTVEQLFKEALQTGLILSIEQIEEKEYRLKVISPQSSEIHYEVIHSEVKELLIIFLLSNFVLQK